MKQEKDSIVVVNFYGDTEIFIYFGEPPWTQHQVCITNILEQLKIRKEDLVTHRDDPLLDLCSAFDFRGQMMRWLETPYLNALLFRIKHWAYKGYQSELIEKFQRYLSRFVDECINDPSTLGEWKSEMRRWTMYAKASLDYKDFVRYGREYKESEPANFTNAFPQIGIDQGYVYVLKMGDHYKIGKSKNVDDRIRSFSPKLPLPVDLVTFFKCKNYSDTEHRLHLRFADKRTNGEWFLLDEGDVAWLCGKKGSIDL